MALRLFGSPLPLEGKIPEIFELTSTFIELHAREVQGIFRISGHKQEIQTICDELEKGERLEFTEQDDIHNVAGVLRFWLQQLPEPIIPFDFYSKYIVFGRSSDSTTKGFKALRKLNASLPQLRITLLVRLIRLLRLISVNSDVNKMGVDNLAIVMTPNILRPRDGQLSGIDALNETSVATKVIGMMIGNYDATLQGLECTYDAFVNVATRERASSVADDGRTRFDPWDVKKALEGKYTAIKDGDNPLAGKKLSDMQITTPKSLAQSHQGTASSGETKPKKTVRIMVEGEDESESSESSDRKTRRRSMSLDAQVPEETKEEKSVTKRRPSVNRPQPGVQSGLDWLLTVSKGDEPVDTTPTDDAREKHNEEVRKLADKEFEKRQQEREDRKVKKEKREQKKKDKIRELAKKQVEEEFNGAGATESSD